MSGKKKDDDSVVIELETAAEDKNADVQVEKVEEPPKKIVLPEEGIAELQKQLKSEKEARLEAEKRAQEEAAKAISAKNEVEDTNLQLVSSAIDTVKTQNASLKADLRAAMSSNDFDRAADIQEILATNAAKLLQLETGKTAMENRPKVDASRAADPIENIAQRVTPASATWLRENRNNLSNEKAIRKMFRAHEDALDDGIIPDTREYFNFIEGRLGIGEIGKVNDDIDPMKDAAQVTQRRNAPPSAPVTRTSSTNGSRPNTVRLTAAEVQFAEDIGMTEQEYARNKLALQKEGLIN